LKKIPGKFCYRKPKVGDLVWFDITWCEGLDPEGNVHSIDTNTMMQYGIVVNIDSREAAEGSSLKRTWDRYYIVWKGINLMYFGSKDHIEVVEEEK